MRVPLWLGKVELVEELRRVKNMAYFPLADALREVLDNPALVRKAITVVKNKHQTQPSRSIPFR